MVVPSALNVTVPLGWTTRPVTVAVKVTDWPSPLGLVLEVTLVEVPSSAKAARVEIVRISAATAAARNALCKTGNENPQPVPSRQ